MVEQKTKVCLCRRAVKRWVARLDLIMIAELFDTFYHTESSLVDKRSRYNDGMAA